MEDDPSVGELLKRVRQLTLTGYAHQEVPFEQVVEALQPPRSMSHSPVFQVMLVLQNTPQGALQLPGLTLSIEEIPRDNAQFDLTLALTDGEHAITETCAMRAICSIEAR